MKVQITLDTEELKVPQGWEIKGVRVAKSGECYLDCGVQLTHHGTDLPVVVVRKSFNIKDWKCTVTAEEIYGKDFKLPSGYEVIDFRCPRAGDLFVLTAQYVDKAHSDWNSPRFIAKKTGE